MTLTASTTAGLSAAFLPAQVPATRDLTKHCEDFTSVPETLLWLLGAPQTSLCTEVTGLVWVLRFPGMAAAWVERSQVGGE